MDPLEPFVFGEGKSALPYRLLKPLKIAEGKRYPLVVFLHGAGERGFDNASQTKHVVPVFVKEREKYPCFLIAPQCPENRKWVEVEWSAKTHAMPKEPSAPMAALMLLIDEFVKKNPVDPDRVFVAGLSMGGFGVWDLLARKPKLFAAGISVCGGGDESTAKEIAHVPVWAFHGDRDAVVIPERSRNMVEALKKAGGSPKYTEFPRTTHDSWTPAFNDPETLKWLFEQKRKQP